MARARRRASVVDLPVLTDLRAVEAGHAVVRVAAAAGRMDPACARLVHRALWQVAAAMRFIEWQEGQRSNLGGPPENASPPLMEHGP